MTAVAYIGPGAGYLFSGPAVVLFIVVGVLLVWAVVRMARGQPFYVFTDKHARWWERQRSHGFIWFVVVRGMLLFGATAMLASLAIEWLWATDLSVGTHLVRSLIQWPITGVVWAAMMWPLYESWYDRWSRDRAG